MFDHPLFDVYSFEEIPLNQDLYLMDEKWMNEYEENMLAVLQGREGEHAPVGFISYAAARNVDAVSAELSWYPNIVDRFHEVLISLPRDEFVACVGCRDYDEKPHIFVRSRWIEHIYLQSYSVFALVDAIGVKQAIKKGRLTRDKLVQLRDRIDALAERYPDILFISLADNVLLKSNWNVGLYGSEIKYSYAPEIFIRLISEILSAFQDVLGLSAYAVLTQGSNAYFEDALSHVSAAGNHISLNSLGLPFSQLLSIEKAARKAIREKVHAPAELYMDRLFFYSLNLSFEFQKDACGTNAYPEPMTGEDTSYVFADCQHLLGNLPDMQQ